MAGYRLGLFLVGFMFASASLICFSAGSGKPESNVSQPPGSSLLEGRPIGPFSLTRETNTSVSSDDLKSSVWLTAFTFTRCPSSCPRISTTLKGLQDQLAGSTVKIVSISVDPKHDTPEILKTYGTKFGADPARWWFLTGSDSEIYSLIQKSFLLSVAPTTLEQQKQGAEEVAHSDRIALVDKDLKLVRFYDSNSPEELKQLVAEAKLHGYRAKGDINVAASGTGGVVDCVAVAGGDGGGSHTSAGRSLHFVHVRVPAVCPLSGGV